MSVSNALYHARSFARHQLTAWHTGGEGIHSPTLFYVVRMVVYDDNAYYAFPRIEQQRTALLRSTDMVQQVDYGTGAESQRSGTPIATLRRVADIARTHLESPKIAQLLFRLVNYLGSTLQKPLTIVELGTSLGITTAYLASPAHANIVQTYEGAQEVLDVAKHVWRELGLTNIEPVIGNINDTLPAHCPKHVDLAYVDANHTYEATLRYFNQLLPAVGEKSIVVVDDIHHSQEMERAWRAIQAEPQVTSTVDCYHAGLVFFNPHYIRKHFRIRI